MRMMLVIGFFLMIPAFGAEDESKALLLERIRPLGAVHEASLPVAAKTADAAPASRSGEAIYQQYCSLCHATGLAGAPKFRDTAEWKTRIEKAGDLAGLVKIAMVGLNVMPPMGTCQDCSQEELKRAIEYMLPK